MVHRIATVVAALALLAIGQKPDRLPERFEKNIRTFEQKAAERPRNAVLFTGSSSIRTWKSLGEDMQGIEVINHGFGGSEISDALYFFDRIVTPVDPRAIVLYAGENDVWHGKSPETVYADFTTFVQRVEAAMPGTPIGFIALKPSPARMVKWPLYQKTNGMIHAACLRHPRLAFLDVSLDMLDESGAPHEELFTGDDLHLNPAGYARWTRRIRPWIESLP